MALSNQHAIAINIVLSWLGIHDDSIERAPVDPDALEAALFGLADAAEAKLHSGVDGDDVARCLPSVLARREGQESDGAAQAVCRAIADHQAHGGSIPWPSIRRPFDEWQQIQEAARVDAIHDKAEAAIYSERRA